MSRTLENKITGYLQSGPKTLTEIRLYFGSKFDAKGELMRMVDKGIIACEPGQKAPGKGGVPPTVYSLIDNSTASAELIDSPAFFALLGCVQQGQKMEIVKHPKCPKPVAKFNGSNVYRKSDAEAFSELIKSGRAQAEEEAKLRANAQANKDINVLRMKVQVAERERDSAIARAAESDKENQRLSVAVNESSKAIAELRSQIAGLEAKKAKFLSFLAWLAQVSGCKATTDFDAMRESIQQLLEQSKNPDIEQLVSAYKNAAALAERNYERINEQHLILMDEYKKIKQDLSWFEILTEHCANFIAVSHKVKDQLWATERANIWRTLHVMGKLKKQ